MRSVTFARASISARSVTMVIQPPSSMPRSAAISGSSSANISGCSSASQGRLRLIAPAVWCSVSRKVVATSGKRGSPVGCSGFSGRSQRMATGLAPTPG